MVGQRVKTCFEHRNEFPTVFQIFLPRFLLHTWVILAQIHLIHTHFELEALGQKVGLVVPIRRHNGLKFEQLSGHSVAEDAGVEKRGRMI